MRFLIFGFGMLAMTYSAKADGVRVVADIAPVHSIVAQVMKGVGTPELIVRPEESPHDFAMRGSTAKALQNADIVFWMGEALVPNLEKPIETVATNATVVQMTEIEESVRYDFREVAVFEGDDHDDGHDEHDDHGEGHDGHHDEHNDSHDDHEAHDGHDENDDHHDEEEHADGHDDHHHHEGLDPHMWLDPENAKVWATHVASVLSTADPVNAAAYKVNADNLIGEIETETQSISALLEPVADHRFVVFHDAFQYFEKRFGLRPAGALLESDARSPSAGRLAEIQEVIEEHAIACVFIEPQYDPKLVAAVAAKAKTGEMDPLGAAFIPGPDLYLEVLSGLGKSVADCLRD